VVRDNRLYRVGRRACVPTELKTVDFGPLRPAPAHPIQSLRDGGDYRWRGGIGPGGAGPYSVVCMAGLNFGQLWDKKRGYKNFFKKSVDGFFWMDRFSLPLISGLKIYLDLWGKSEFFDNGVFFCLVTDKGIRSTAVLF
jgi:hypothetical protein